MFVYQTVERYSLTLAIVTFLVKLSSGGYKKVESPLSFCDSVDLCHGLGGGLPLMSDLTSLQSYMNDGPDTLIATWMLIDESAISGTLHYCSTTRIPDSCPGLVALPAGTKVLKTPLADCTRSSVEIAVCEQPSPATGFQAYRLIEEWTGGSSRIGSFCHVHTTCKLNNMVVPSSATVQGTDLIQNVLDSFKKSGAWLVSQDASNNWRSFCSNGGKFTKCPGEILLHELTSVVFGSLVGCDVTLPVVCEMPGSPQASKQPVVPGSSTQATTTTTTSITSLTTNTAVNTDDSQTGSGKNNGSGNLALILGVVAGLLVVVVIIVIVVFVLLRKKKPRLKGGRQFKKHIMAADNPTYNVEPHDIISGSIENDYADIDDVIDPPAKSGLPLHTSPPPIGADPGYTEVTDPVSGNGYLGTYEDIDGLREDLQSEQTQNKNAVTKNTELILTAIDSKNNDNKYLTLIPGSDCEGPVDKKAASHGVTGVSDVSCGLGVFKSPRLYYEPPVYAEPIKSALRDDVDQDEVTLVENTVYG